jgi:ribonuclease HI
MGHVTLWQSMVDEDPLWIAPSDYMISITLPNHSYRVIIPERETWQEGFLLQLGADHALFTDGSLCDGLSGAGVYSASLEIDLSFRLGRFITVFQAEIFAISAGASYCVEKGIRNSKIVFCVDSQSALLSLRSDKFQSKLVLECFNLLKQLSRENEITLVWVPGHEGIAGNERADGLARDGSKEPATGPAPFLPLSKSWATESIRGWVQTKVSERWQKLSTCRQTKCFVDKPLNSGNIRQIHNLDRRRLRLLCGFLTGHYSFKKHLLNLGLATSTLCPRCQEEEDTAFHAVCNCAALASRRNTILGGFVLDEREAKGLKIEDILKFAMGIDFD